MNGENNIPDPYKFVSVYNPNKANNNLPEFGIFYENSDGLIREDSYDYDIDITDEDRLKEIKEQETDKAIQNKPEQDMEVDQNK
jgi:hypothetical protein